MSSLNTTTIAEALTVAVQHHQDGRLREAEQLYRQIVQADPQQADAWCYRGLACLSLGWADEAANCLQQAIRLKPDYADACANLGSTLRLLGKLDEAVASCKQALGIDPNLARAHHELGMIFTELDRLDEAVASYEQALRLKPDYFEAYNNLGAVLSGMGRFDESFECYQRALRLSPHNVEAHCNFALLLLIQGNFAQGMAEYEWRWHKRDVTLYQFHQPRWDGSSLAGRTILLHFEQGLGDSLQFIRYASLVKQRGGRVVLGCSESLRPLLATCPGVDQAVSTTANLHFDVYAPLLSLPRIFGTTVETIPADVPYLFADPALVRWWGSEVVKGRQGDKETRRQGDKETQGVNLTTTPAHHSPLTTHHSPLLKIGIAWQGNPRNVADRHRSMPLACLRASGPVAGGASLQLAKRTGNRTACPGHGSSIDRRAGQPLRDHDGYRRRSGESGSGYHRGFSRCPLRGRPGAENLGAFGLDGGLVLAAGA